jgi:hypothetical protein
MSVGESTETRRRRNKRCRRSSSSSGVGRWWCGSEGEQQLHYCCVALLDASVRELQMKMKQGIVRLQM